MSFIQEQEGTPLLPELRKLSVKRKSGEERFQQHGSDLGFDVLSFWQWIGSDLVSNSMRGVLAEYLVARVLGLGVDGIRNEWDAFDLVTPNGLKIEVKSAAYVQTWHQKQLSKISFLVRKTKSWDSDTNVQSKESRRHADVYVFALLFHQDKGSINPLQLDQWEFYVVPTTVLDARTRSQHSITLKSLRQLGMGPVGYSELPAAVKAAGKAITNRRSEAALGTT